MNIGILTRNARPLVIKIITELEQIVQQKAQRSVSFPPRFVSVFGTFLKFGLLSSLHPSTFSYVTDISVCCRRYQVFTAPCVIRCRGSDRSIQRLLYASALFFFILLLCSTAATFKQHLLS